MAEANPAKLGGILNCLSRQFSLPKGKQLPPQSLFVQLYIKTCISNKNDLNFKF